ncbi:pentapeptide repeat-containing protein [Buchananella felis]|uniref:pentapeptide repeat-containing protein n=1 Tax=Buchananella felis TaxID=3231492 RepID=UPI0035299FF1
MKEHKEAIVVFSSSFGGLALVSLVLFLTQKQAFSPHTLGYVLAVAGVVLLAAAFKWGPCLWRWNSASTGISKAVSKSISDDPATRMAGINQLISIADTFGGKYRAQVVGILCAAPSKITVDAFFEHPEGGDFDQAQLAKQRGLAQEQSHVIEALRARFRPQSPAQPAAASSAGSTAAADPSMRDWRDCNLSFHSFGVPSHFLVPFNFDHCEVNGKADFKNSIFAAGADFTRTTFREPVRFAGARFDGPVRFDGVRFEGGVDFTGVHFAQPPSFVGATGPGGAPLEP